MTKILHDSTNPNRMSSTTVLHNGINAILKELYIFCLFQVLPRKETRGQAGQYQATEIPRHQPTKLRPCHQRAGLQ